MSGDGNPAPSDEELAASWGADTGEGAAPAQPARVLNQA